MFAGAARTIGRFFRLLALGALAEAFGPRAALAAGGSACVLGAIRLAAARRRLRREMKPVLEPIGAALP